MSKGLVRAISLPTSRLTPSPVARRSHVAALSSRQGPASSYGEVLGGLQAMPISVEELLSAVRKYWRSDHEFDGKLERSPELERFQALWKQELKKLAQWRVLMRELRAALPRLEIGHATATSTSCFRCTVFTDRQPVEASHEDGLRERHWGVVGCLSILAPTYTVYGLQ